MTTTRRPAALLAGLAATASGLALATVPTAQAADNPYAFVGERGIVLSTHANVNVREPGAGRSVVVPDGARIAYAAGEQVAYERGRRVFVRDLENDVRLRPGAGVDAQRLLGMREVGDAIVVVMQETREAAPGEGYGDVRSDLVTHDTITGERTVLRGDFQSFETGYARAHVTRDGSVIAEAFDSASSSVQRFSADGTRQWGKRVAVDDSANLAVIGDRVTVIRNRTTPRGEQVLRVVRLDADTGARRSARSVRVPNAASAPFCGDWRSPRRLACQTVQGPVVVDAFGGRGVVTSVRAPASAVMTVIGGR